MEKLNWSKLPSEILNIVLLYLKKSDKSITQKKNDLSQCALTCRGWRDASQVVFFSDINLNAKNDVKKLFRLLLVNNKLGTLIKALSFSCYLDNSNDITILFALDSHFPNLENLNFSGDNLLYSSFAKMVIENGNFRNLRGLLIPMNTVQDQIYLQCINFLKDRVKIIELFDDHTNNRNNYSDLREKLNNFPNLKEIVIHTAARDIHPQTYMKYLEEFVVDKLESLKKISIMTSENHNNRFQLFAPGHQETLYSTTKLKNVHVIINNEAYALPSKNFMLFMMNKFPEINKFRLEHVFQTCQNLEAPYSALLPFLKYLSAMSNYLLQNIVLTNEGAIKLIKELYTVPEVEAASTKLLRCLHVKQKLYDNSHSSYNARSDSPTLSIKNISPRKQNIKITLNSKSYNYYDNYSRSQNSK